MIDDMSVCPMCFSIFVLDYYEGDECPECDSETILISWREHLLRLGTSFGESLSQYRGLDELGQ